MKKLVFALFFLSASALAGPPPQDSSPIPPPPPGPVVGEPGMVAEPPLPAESQGYLLKEVVLSTCYSFPTFDPARDVVEGGHSFSITMGYIIRRNIMLILLSPDGRVVFERTVHKDENKIQTFWGPSYDFGRKDGKVAPVVELESRNRARLATIEIWNEFYNERRHFVCRGER